jgi:hypothetical protein
MFAVHVDTDFQSYLDKLETNPNSKVERRHYVTRFENVKKKITTFLQSFANFKNVCPGSLFHLRFEATVCVTISSSWQSAIERYYLPQAV